MTFSDADRGPGNTLQIGPVTVSSVDLGAQPIALPATVTGIGLGLAQGLGTDGEAIRQLVYSAGNYWPDSDTGGQGFTLSVIGASINSFSLQPVFSVNSGSGLVQAPGTIGFDVCSWGAGTSPYFHFSGSDSAPITIQCAANTSFLGLSLQSDFPPAQYFLGYRQDNLAEAQTFRFGFSLLSLDVSVVPEPGAFGFLTLAILAVAARKTCSRIK